MSIACLRDAFAALLAVAAVTACSGKVEGGPLAEDKPPPAVPHLEDSIVVGSERPAGAYEEAVTIAPEDASIETCTGVIVAPRVVLTAAHCVVYARSKTWTVTAPFAPGGVETHVATDGEPMDAGFRNVNRADYALHEMRDLAVLYTTVPFAGARRPILEPTAYAAGKGAVPVFVSAVGRATAASPLGLALSAMTSLESAAPSIAGIDYATARLTGPAESGGPLFVEGTHQLVGVHAHVTANGKNDVWARLDGDAFTWIREKVTFHGGWTNDSPSPR